MSPLPPKVPSSPDAWPPAPYFHDDSGAVRFWVHTDDGQDIGASISRQALHFRFRAEMGGADALASYLTHKQAIDAAVRRRLAKGSLEPVMLRESDLAAPPEK